MKFLLPLSTSLFPHFLAIISEKIGSRRVIQWASLIMVIQGVVSKFGAIFIMIPDPVVGGIFCVMFGMITAFGYYTQKNRDFAGKTDFHIVARFVRTAIR